MKFFFRLTHEKVGTSCSSQRNKRINCLFPTDLSSTDPCCSTRHLHNQAWRSSSEGTQHTNINLINMAQLQNKTSSKNIDTHTLTDTLDRAERLRSCAFHIVILACKWVLIIIIFWNNQNTSQKRSRECFVLNLLGNMGPWVLMAKWRSSLK